MKSEPVMIMGLIGSMLSLLVAFGVKLNDPQLDAVKTVAAQAVVIVLLWRARASVTPTAKLPGGPTE